MIIREETVDQAWPEISALMQKHFFELSKYADKLKLDIDLDYYKKLELVNLLRVYAIRDNDEKMIGYAVFTVMNHLRYKYKIAAQNDVIFLLPEYRKGFTGVKIVKEITSRLLEEADLVTWHVKDSHDFSPILTRMGFVKQDTVYSFLKE